MAQRFNRLGIKDIDLTDWHDEVICHGAQWNKRDGEVFMTAEFRVTLYGPDGKSYTAVIETKLEEQ